MPDTFAGLAAFAFLTLTSTLLDSFLLPIKAFRVKTAFPSDFLISMRVVPLSATAIEYLSLPESYARYNESGHASHAHLIYMYSPSAADFLSVESVSLFFIGNSIYRILRIRIRCSLRESCQSAFRLRTVVWCLCRCHRSKGGCASWLRQGTRS